MPKVERFNPMEYARAQLESQIKPLDPVAWVKKKTGVDLWSKQREICKSVEENKLTAVKSGHGVGKALRLDEVVPTPSGWSTIRDLRVGDFVLNECGRPSRVTSKSEVWFGDTYRIVFSDGTTLDTHAEHEWNAFDLNLRKRVPGIRNSTLKDWRTVWDYSQIVTTKQIAKSVKTLGGQNRWKIPTSQAVDLPNVVLPIDPYTFGVWLGDGTSLRGEFTKNHVDAVEILSHIPYETYIVPSTVRESTQVYRVDGLYTQLNKLGCIGNKHIPMQFLRASVDQRRELVRGIMDADGYHRGGGDDEISVSNKQLAQDIYDLFITLGLSVRISESDSTLNGRVVGRRWRIGCRFDFNPYHLNRYDWKPADKQSVRHTQRTVVECYKIENVATQCIEVDSPRHLFLAGRNMVPTHNSFTTSNLAAWWVDTHPTDETMVISTAPSTHQVSAIMWEEIRKIHRNAGLLGEVQRSDRWLVGTQLVGYGRKPQDYDKHAFQGLHRKYLLIIIDEACGVDDWLWTAARSMATGTHNRIIAIGNPDDPTSHFAKVCKPTSGWNVIKVSVFDSPNFTGEEGPEIWKETLTDHDYVKDMREDFGEGSPTWTSKVLGEFPEIDEMSTIPLGWVYRAQERWQDWYDSTNGLLSGRYIIGADIARYGGDKTAFAHKYGNVVNKVEVMPGGDTELTADRLLENKESGATAVVDTNGIGAGVFDKLRRRGMSALPLNVGNRTSATDSTGQIRFYNLKSQATWKLREMLDPNKGATLCLPPGDQLAEDLSAPRWKNMAGGQLLVEDKKEVRKRLSRSPDRGDAVILACWLSSEVEITTDNAAFNWVDPLEDVDRSDDDDYALEWYAGDDEPEMISYNAHSSSTYYEFANER